MRIILFLICLIPFVYFSQSQKKINAQLNNQVEKHNYFKDSLLKKYQYQIKNLDLTDSLKILFNEPILDISKSKRIKQENKTLKSYLTVSEEYTNNLSNVLFQLSKIEKQYNEDKYALTKQLNNNKLEYDSLYNIEQKIQEDLKKYIELKISSNEYKAYNELIKSIDSLETQHDNYFHLTSINLNKYKAKHATFFDSLKIAYQQYYSNMKTIQNLKLFRYKERFTMFYESEYIGLYNFKLRELVQESAQEIENLKANIENLKKAKVEYEDFYTWTFAFTTKLKKIETELKEINIYAKLTVLKENYSKKGPDGFSDAYSDVFPDVFPTLYQIANADVTPIDFEQTNLPQIEDTSIVYDVVDEIAEFPGGFTALKEHLKNNMKYPQTAVESEIEGRCYVKFTVNSNGQISNVKVKRGVLDCPECDQEAIRLIKAMPKWKPGTINGKPVNSTFTLPVLFKLD